MKIRTRRSGSVSLESFAITDIILNMFIFFFTSFSLVYTFNPARESRIQVKLPQAEVRTPPAQKEPIVVSIDARGDVYIADGRVALGEVSARVRTLLNGNTATAVIVRSDKSVIFDKVIQVLDAVKKSGAERLSLAVEEKRAPPKGNG